MTLKTTFHTHVGIIVEFTIVITSRRRWAADDRSRSQLWVTVYPCGRSFVVATAATLRTRANPELLEEQAAPPLEPSDVILERIMNDRPLPSYKPPRQPRRKSIRSKSK